MIVLLQLSGAGWDVVLQGWARDSQNDLMRSSAIPHHGNMHSKRDGAPAAVVLVLVLLAGCGGSSGSSSTEPTSTPASYTPPSPTKIVYEVEGVATDATVTMATPTGQTQEDIPDLAIDVNKHQRWTFNADEFSGLGFLYISIQGGDEYTSVTCRIKVGGEVVSENSSNAAYGIATCQGNL
jgi:hypothetical protein